MANRVVAYFVKMVSFSVFKMDEKPGLGLTSKASVVWPNPKFIFQRIV